MCPDRTAPTLLSIIYEHVVPDTTVNSVCWPSYNKISLLHQSKLKHQTVNHKYNFVDPTSSTHTNKIESKWCVAKVKFKDIRGCTRMYIQSYLDEFMWRQNNNVLCHFFRTVSTLIFFFFKSDTMVIKNM
jgi:hypothetical protein